MRLIKKIAIGSVLFGIAHLSYAEGGQCVRTKNTPAEKISVNFGLISISNNLHKGDVIDTFTTTLPSTKSYYTGCPDSVVKLKGAYVGWSAPSDEYNTIPTGIPGIGMKISYVVNGINTDFGNTPSNAVVGLTNMGITDDIIIVAELIKTENSVGAGVLSKLGGGKGELYLDGYDSKEPMAIIDFSNAAEIAANSPSCNVNIDGNAGSTVTLPPVSLSSFSGTGSTAGNKDFTLNIKCAGIINKSVFIHFEPVDNDSTNDQDGIFYNTNKTSSGAKNIGIQVLYQGNPMFLYNRNVIGTIGEDGLSYDVKMSARYYQLGSNPSGGKVESSMLYVLNYN